MGRKNQNPNRRAALALLALAAAAPAFATQPNSARYTLIGEVSGIGRAPVRITIFAVDRPYTAATETDYYGEFQFHSLPSGDYTVSILKNSLGATRRTAVVSAGLADEKGVIRVAIDYQAAEAAGASGGTVSRNSLSIPEQARKKYAESQRFLGKHDVDGAKRSLQAAVDLAPQFTQAWNALGMIAYQSHDLTAAEKLFRTAIAAEPGAFEPVANLAGVLLSQGRFEDSLEMSKRALAQRPADALANVQAGIAWFALRDYDRAEIALLQTVRVDPAHFSKPQLFLADIYIHRGEPEAAVAALKDYLDRRPDAEDAPYQRRRIQQLENLLVP